VGVGWTKRALHHAMDVDFDAAIRFETEAEIDCFRSPDTRARLQAFVDRRR
jgi:hypothetical protein